MSGVDMTGVAAVAAGSILAYAGVKGFSLPQAVQYLVQGKSPATLPQTAGISPPTASSASSASTGSGSVVAGGGSAQAALQQTAAQFGWGSGAQWQALQAIEVHEAGFSPTAKNPTSGALGLAQALGHGGAGTAGSLGNEYGAQYGLTTAQAQAANSGDAPAQALWMCGYIKSRYGDPIKAWSFWQAHHWY
jgi:hypothetical protein